MNNRNYRIFLALMLLLAVGGTCFFTSKIADLKKQNFDLRKQLAASPEAERSKFRALLKKTGIQERGIRVMSFHVFERGSNFTNSFLDLFSISESEHTELSKISTYVWSEYYRLSKINSRVSVTADGKTLVEIDPFEGAAELYSNLLQAYERVLGAGRYSDLMAFAEDEMQERFLQFGGKKIEVYVFNTNESRDNLGKRELHVRAYEVEAKLEGHDGKTLKWGTILSEESFARKFEVIERIISDSQPLASGNADKPPA